MQFMVDLSLETAISGKRRLTTNGRFTLDLWCACEADCKILLSMKSQNRRLFVIFSKIFR